MTERRIRMTSYILMVLSLFLGNFYKVQADIDGFVKVEGVKGYAIITDEIGFFVLPFSNIISHVTVISDMDKATRSFSNRLFDWECVHDYLSTTFHEAL
ncbi:hypothetical protein [Listeria cornellensis]|uniref:Uncharacterized protein n=1 Tax=Listeria cornellensis FSL F6-0969 TaxID=1265820 RepID=W7C702_9LIST|nr:hypothetical protein [Listeria cornellensis]EUJ31441.1 hypothetical protein PCORN_05276 [Listeria cornellensis FSL F6-0969]